MLASEYLAISEAGLREQRDSYHALLHSALDGWHGAIRQIDQLRERHRDLLDEYRKFRAETMAQDIRSERRAA